MNFPKSKLYNPIPSEGERAAKIALDAAFKVHTALGPGLLESVYEACMVHEIHKAGALVETQVSESYYKKPL